MAARAYSLGLIVHRFCIFTLHEKRPDHYFTLSCGIEISAKTPSSDMTKRLVEAMNNSKNYDLQKERQLFHLKKEATKENLSQREQYEINQQLPILSEQRRDIF